MVIAYNVNQRKLMLTETRTVKVSECLRINIICYQPFESDIYFITDYQHTMDALQFKSLNSSLIVCWPFLSENCYTLVLTLVF